VQRALATFASAVLGVAMFVGVAGTVASGASASVSVRQVSAEATGVSGVSTTGTITLGSTSGQPVTIGTDPVGLSIEYPVLANDLGSGPCPPPGLVETLESLGAPTIRIGGDSQDETAPAGTPAFTGVTDLPADFWSQLACLESQTHEPFAIGLNLVSQVPAWAATMASEASSAVPANLLSFEVGNESDIAGPAVPWWDATGLAHTLMPFSNYLEDAQATAAQLPAGANIEGPDFATERWIPAIPKIAAALSLHTIDTHFYPLNACTGRKLVSVKALLSAGASELDPPVRATLAAALSLHLPMVISESNSVSCRGLAGVSDSPASAVWGLRLVINALVGGIASVRFHSSASSYDPFVVVNGIVTVRPLYLGLRAAVDLLPLGAQLQSLRTPSSLLGVVVTLADGQKTYIVSNYAQRSLHVRVRAQGNLALLRVVPNPPVVENQSQEATAGSASVAVAPNSVVAITVSG
jgi:hypothetical protein